ncbi:Helix-loop-helix DNA-binding domain [Musa troglodytarum]|uniref:Helix-loop-helix DNA-binding domain n=1 Tax=Musa troglodytarum TaxID=320322 RepID=A0A9E7LEK6_9LILI|nr:Helix-loop-helix DNA-binding domain [Musa troglodytarum]URE47659.1 Helix-loop-helix DNA-binding domain [Musa troglodytarum]
MNEQLSVLRSLMPFFYAKRGDQATIIGGAVEYIKELQQVLQSLEAKKQRKAYGEVVLSPRPVPSPRPPHWSPRPPPLSPSSASELTANSNSAVAEVEVKFSGPNVILKTVSHRIRGQVLKIVAALEGLALEILHVSISITDDTMLNSFTIKVRTTTTAHQMWFCWYSHSKMSSFSFLLLCLLTLSNKAASQDSL